MTDPAILQHISKLPHARATFKQLVRELGSRGASREEVDAALDRLTDRGDIVEVRSGHFFFVHLGRSQHPKLYPGPLPTDPAFLNNIVNRIPD